MKSVMRKEGTGGLFAYLGPQDKAMKAQGVLLPADDIGSLKEELQNRFTATELTFDELLDLCCDDNELAESDYRAALKALREGEKIGFQSVTSKTPRGMQGKDLISFP